jgi:hypothetical protein
MKQSETRASGQPTILAALYSDGIEADRMIAQIAYGLRDEGLMVAGLVQRNEFIAGRRRCNMEMEEMASRTVLTISEDRGPLARGCRLDRAALARAESLLMDALAMRPDIVIINKFGKSEAEGGGLREPISIAAQLGVPTVVGVPYRNLEQWRAFAGEFAEEVTAERDPILCWLERWGLCCSVASPGAHSTQASVDMRLRRSA